MALPKDFNAEAVYAEAFNAARKASAEYIAENGELPFNCGFAWVTIKPARGKFVNWCKKNNIGSSAYGGGWQIWNPSDFGTQDMSVKSAGARAFANVLEANGVKAYAGSRLD